MEALTISGYLLGLGDLKSPPPPHTALPSVPCTLAASCSPPTGPSPPVQPGEEYTGSQQDRGLEALWSTGMPFLQYKNPVGCHDGPQPVNGDTNGFLTSELAGQL